MSQLVFTTLPNLPMFQEGNNLHDILDFSLFESSIKLQNGDVLVIAQKIISKIEGRTVNLATVNPSEIAIEIANEVKKDARLVELILNESSEVIRMKPGLIITRHRSGFISANAGIDTSNVAGSNEWVLLLPEDSDQSARKIREYYAETQSVNIGILIIDSHGRAWRKGTSGLTIGLAGVPGVVDRRGEEDLFGYTIVATDIGVADELAAGASLLMGQVNEGTPIIHARGFPYDFRDSSLSEILRDKDKDLFV
jgi:coenzyme F420-0:L-glutamate ligase / coenzyme F420-1:gamma-L-glutamate ligase